jgi:hypothetical protein
MSGRNNSPETTLSSPDPSDGSIAFSGVRRAFEHISEHGKNLWYPINARDYHAKLITNAIRGVLFVHDTDKLALHYPQNRLFDGEGTMIISRNGVSPGDIEVGLIDHVASPRVNYDSRLGVQVGEQSVTDLFFQVSDYWLRERNAVYYEAMSSKYTGIYHGSPGESAEELREMINSFEARPAHYTDSSTALLTKEQAEDYHRFFAQPDLEVA